MGKSWNLEILKYKHFWQNLEILKSWNLELYVNVFIILKSWIIWCDQQFLKSWNLELRVSGDRDSYLIQVQKIESWNLEILKYELRFVLDYGGFWIVARAMAGPYHDPTLFQMRDLIADPWFSHRASRPCFKYMT